MNEIIKRTENEECGVTDRIFKKEWMHTDTLSFITDMRSGIYQKSKL